MECIILAAGLSSRMGTNKMLLPIHNKTMIESCIDTFYDSCTAIYVVVGHRKEELLPILSQYNKVRIAENADYKDGMFSSVKIGVRYIRSPFFFLTPGDMPFIQKSTVSSLSKSCALLTMPVYNGLSGHPIMLHRSLIPHILASDKSNLAECLSSVPRDLIQVSDEGIITDIDSAKDYWRCNKRRYE